MVLPLTELQKEEEGSCVTDGPSAPPVSTPSLDPSHPYYDVARHGIIQVSGKLRFSQPVQNDPPMLTIC